MRPSPSENPRKSERLELLTNKFFEDTGASIKKVTEDLKKTDSFGQFNPISNVSIVRFYRKGRVFGSTTLLIRDMDIRMARLSDFLYFIGVSEDDKLITELRENWGKYGFDYPPENGIRYQKE